METPITLNFVPVNTPHKDLYYMPLVDKDFQIKYLSSNENHLQIFRQARDNYISGFDILGLWESNLPMYFLPSVHVFLDIIHHCCANYDPNQRPVMSPNQTILFPITTQSINEMFQFHSSHILTPLFMGYLLEKAPQFS